MSIVIGILSLLLTLFAVLFYGGRAIIKSVRNPLPTMENGDNRFKDVMQYKTREIRNFSLGVG